MPQRSLTLSPLQQRSVKAGSVGCGWCLLDRKPSGPHWASLYAHRRCSPRTAPPIALGQCGRPCRRTPDAIYLEHDPAQLWAKSKSRPPDRCILSPTRALAFGGCGSHRSAAKTGISSAQAGSIAKVGLVRLGAATHSQGPRTALQQSPALRKTMTPSARSWTAYASAVRPTWRFGFPPRTSEARPMPAACSAFFHGHDDYSGRWTDSGHHECRRHSRGA
jgi:hypothetical protein